MASKNQVPGAKSADPKPKKAGLLRLRVSAVAESIVRAGHPWLFAQSIRSQNRTGQLGDLAAIYDRNDHFLALGLFDPDSPLRVRVFHTGKRRPVDRAFWCEKLEKALQVREGLFDDLTNGYRWINGESDGWPGLVLDRYDTTLVLKLYTAAWLVRLGPLIEIIVSRLRPERIILRLSRNVRESAARFGDRDGDVIWGDPLTTAVVFTETGLRFEVDVLRGQKTGFFLDQRENRKMVESLARGRAVLNVFSFSGGFSIYAARGGAASVVDLDMSPLALAAARRNFSLNKSQVRAGECAHEGIQTDAFEWLASNTGRKFGLVVLDPPSLAKRESERTGAIAAYRKLAASGIDHLSPGGILVACSCSAHVSEDQFFEAVLAAVKRSKRGYYETARTGQPVDHPAIFKEARYLKGIHLRLD